MVGFDRAIRQVSISEIEACAALPTSPSAPRPMTPTNLVATTSTRQSRWTTRAVVGRVAGLIAAIQEASSMSAAPIRVVSRERRDRGASTAAKRLGVRLVARNAMLLAVEKAREFGVASWRTGHPEI